MAPRIGPTALTGRMMSIRRLTCGNVSGRYWVRTSDLFGVNEARYHCANRPAATPACRWRPWAQASAGLDSSRFRRSNSPGSSGAFLNTTLGKCGQYRRALIKTSHMRYISGCLSLPMVKRRGRDPGTWPRAR
jgi:hypothetical protein